MDHDQRRAWNALRFERIDFIMRYEDEEEDALCPHNGRVTKVAIIITPVINTLLLVSYYYYIINLLRD